jgi:hypothetical protein
MAQVYSVNAVGYVNKTFPNAGFYIISNPLNNGNNQIGTVIPTAPDNTIVYKFAGGAFGEAITYFAGAGWFGSAGASTDVIAPGEGLFIQIPAAATLPATLTFVGDVPQGSLTQPIPAGFSLQASAVPISAGLSTTGNSGMSFPAVDNDTVYFYNGVTQSYKDAITFFAGAGWFDSAGANDPTPAVGEGFFLSRTGAAGNWARTFTVN